MNKISDISPLSNRVKLRMLNVYENPITDIKPLANLYQLRKSETSSLSLPSSISKEDKEWLEKQWDKKWQGG